VPPSDRETFSDAQFYRALLRLGEHDTMDGLLRQALDLIVRRAGPSQALIEIVNEDGGADGSYVVAHGCEDGRVTEIRGLVSRGIIGAALATGKTVLASNAAEDPRFLTFASVRRNRLEAVLCAPVGRDVPVGVVYLQGRAGRADARAYDEALQGDAELLALSLAPPVERLLARGNLSSRPSRPHATGTPEEPFSSILGKSRAIRDVIDRLRLAAPLDVHILLTGPSGSGKTLLANAVHLASRRRTYPFVEINCATLPEALLENELFGADAGAHSAVPKGGIRGKVEAAEGGTLFLDEIAELSLGAQAKLLQLLQSRTYYRLGGTRLCRADVRVLAATNVELKIAVAEKRFREDLYYRLLVLEARVPSLAERPEDLTPLSVGFLRNAVQRHGFPHKTLSPSAIHAIQAAPWPGNVRELANRIESATIQAHLRGADRIEAQDVFRDAPPSDTEAPASLQEATRRFQRKHLLLVLESTDWNVMDAARMLDVSRSQAYALIRAFDLKRC
jgi:Nif-specific regulatory protein